MCCRTVNNLLANFLERSCRSGGLVSDQSRPHAEIIIVLHSTELFRAQPARAGALHSLGASAGHGEIGAGVSDLKALCASAERGRRRPDRRPRTTRTWNEAPRPAGAGWCVPASRRARAPRRPRPLGISGSHLSSCPCSVRGRSDALPGRASSSTAGWKHRSALRLAPSSRVSCVT